MTFNRYIAFRMTVELIGAIACATQLLGDGNVLDLAVTAAVALVWACGEIRVALILRRERPRADELSDHHQLMAARFAMMATVVALMAVGFASMIGGLTFRTFVMVSPSALPSLAMLILATADARYLWLERDCASGAEDDDAVEHLGADPRGRYAASADADGVSRQTPPIRIPGPHRRLRRFHAIVHAHTPDIHRPLEIPSTRKRCHTMRQRRHIRGDTGKTTTRGCHMGV